MRYEMPLSVLKTVANNNQRKQEKDKRERPRRELKCRFVKRMDVDGVACQVSNSPFQDNLIR